MAKHILMLGIGGTGSNIASRLQNVRNKDAVTKVQCIAVDTASEELERITNIPTLDLGSIGLFKEIINDFGREEIDNFYLDLQSKNLSYIENIQTHTGSNTWRIKSNIMFEEFIKDEVKLKIFDDVFSSVLDEKDKNPQYEMYIVTSIAGGTGSSLLIPLATFLKSYFEKEYKANLKITTLLILPEVYRDSLTKELQTKAYANAYMVLRELNAYDICGILNNKKDNNSYFQLLNKYNKTNTNPFEQIYLFDRIPGLGSIALHEHIICDIVNYMSDLEVKSIFKSNKENKSYDNYSTITLSKIKYPKDRIIQYLNCQRNYDILNNTYGNFINTLLTSIRADHKSLESNKDLTLEYFAQKVYELSTTYNSEKDINENIFVGEEYDSDLYKNESYSIVNKYYHELKEAISTYYDIDEYHKLQEIIKKIEIASKTKSRRIKKQTKKYIESESSNIYQYIKNIYDYSFDFLNESNFNLSEKFTDKENMGDHLSFVSNLFYNKTNCLPGIIHLSRLAYLYIKLCNDTNGYELPTKTEIKNQKNHENHNNNEQDVFNTKLLEINNIFSPIINDDTYIDNGTKRLINLLNGKKFDYLSLQALNQDLNNVFERVSQMNFLLLLKQNVEKYLKVYQSLVMPFNRILNNYNKYVSEVKESSVVDSQSIHYYHNSIEEKLESYTELVLEERKDKNNIANINETYGRELLKVVENILNNNLETPPIMDYFQHMEKTINPMILNSEVGKKILNNSVVRLMIDDINKGSIKDVKHLIHSLIDSVFMPIRINKQNIDEKINQSKVLIISTNQANLINSIDFKKTNIRVNSDKLHTFMALLDQYDASIHVQDSVLDNELYVVNCIESLKLTQIDLVSEDSKGLGYYSHYEKACENAKCKETPMWSPNLYLGKKVIFDLPYISTYKDETHNENIMKALIYCLTNQEIKSKTYKELNKSIYYLTFNDEDVFMIVNGEEVKEKEYDKLVLFFKNNEYLTDFYANKFDNILLKLKSILPFTSVIDPTLSIVKLIAKNAYYKAWKDNLFINNDQTNPLNLVTLAYQISQMGLILNHDFGLITLKMIVNSFYNLVRHEQAFDIEKTKITLGLLLNNFFDFKNNSKEVTNFIKDNLKELLSIVIPEEDIFAVENIIIKK